MEILRASIVWLFRNAFAPFEPTADVRLCVASKTFRESDTQRANNSRRFERIPCRRPPSSGTVLIPLTLAIAAAIIFPIEAEAQVDEYQVKAAFLFNFAKFVQWPAQTFKTPTDPIAICILGKNPFGKTLEETIKGKTVGGRTLDVLPISDTQPPGSCQILFVPSSERKRFRSILARLKGAGVLSVGEAGEFTAEGGVINFSVEHGNISLEINVAAAEYTGVHISAKLLSLSHVVRMAP